MTDFSISTPLYKLLPVVSFKYNIKVNNKFEIVEEKYSDFEIGFIENYQSQVFIKEF